MNSRLFIFLPCFDIGILLIWKRLKMEWATTFLHKSNTFRLFAILFQSLSTSFLLLCHRDAGVVWGQRHSAPPQDTEPVRSNSFPGLVHYLDSLSKYTTDLTICQQRGISSFHLKFPISLLGRGFTLMNADLRLGISVNLRLSASKSE